MYLWILIITALIFQESASAGAVFVLALQNNISLWPIHLIWAIATFFDMYVGFIAGRFMHARFKKARVISVMQRWMGKLKKWMGGRGEKLSLALLGIIDFPYLNTFFAAWLGFSLKDAFIATFLGNLLWYILVWGAVLGLHNLIANPAIILFIIVAGGILSNLIFRSWGHKAVKS